MKAKLDLNSIFQSARNGQNIYPQDLYSDVQEWIQRNISEDQEAYTSLVENSFSSDLKIKDNCFNQINNIIKENTETDKRCNRSKLVIIGNGKNGDLIVYDILSKKVGYILHDDYWEDNQIDPRDCLVLSKFNISEFFIKAYTDEYFPCDGYDLEESEKYRI